MPSFFHLNILFGTETILTEKTIGIPPLKNELDSTESYYILSSAHLVLECAGVTTQRAKILEACEHSRMLLGAVV